MGAGKFGFSVGDFRRGGVKDRIVLEGLDGVGDSGGMEVLED